jgi:hypothetical protein
MTSRTLYGSNVASTTLPSAGKLATTTGGSETDSYVLPATNTTGYLEAHAISGAPGTVYSNSPPAPTGYGWLYDSTALEGQTITAGNWSVSVTLSDNNGAGTILNATILIRFYKRSSAGIYTPIGSIPFSGQTLHSKTTYALPATDMPGMSFSTGDKLYVDLFVYGRWTNGGTDYLFCYESNSGTAGVASDMQITTPDYNTNAPTGKATLAIGNNPVIFLEDDQFSHNRVLDDRKRFQVNVVDYTGTLHFPYSAQIVLTDASRGVIFSGYIMDDQETPIYPGGGINHQLDCIDKRFLADKRTTQRVYTEPTPAGKIVIDMVDDTLAAEGVIANYGLRYETTQADLNQGELTSVVSTNNVGDGDLELVSSASVSETYNSVAQWNTGTLSSVQANSGGDLSLIGQIRNWDDGNKSNQTLYGFGSPTDGISSGQYFLTCTANSETRSRQDYAGTWAAPFTIEVDATIVGDVPRTGFTYLTTGWVNDDNSYAYALEFHDTDISLRRGTNGSAGSSVALASYSFSPKLADGTYRLRVVVSGSTHTVYVNGTQYLSVSDGTYTTAGYIALRNRNTEPSVSITFDYDNFGIMKALSGTWTGPSTSINSVSTIASSTITWDTSLSTGGTVTVQTSIDGGSTYQTCTSGGVIPGLAAGASGTGKSVIVKVTLANTTTATMPDIRNLQWTVQGGYTSSGTRSTAPLGIDTMVRANQSGLGTSADGQTYTKVGTGTDAISGDEATITNTTGDVHEVLGSNTYTDEDGTVRFQLSASTISAGIELRYVDSNNFYRFSANTTTLTLLKKVLGTTTTIKTASVSLSTGVWYRMRFRIVGFGPASLYGNVWADGTIEPTLVSPFTWSITATD